MPVDFEDLEFELLKGLLGGKVVHVENLTEIEGRMITGLYSKRYDFVGPYQYKPSKYCVAFIGTKSDRGNGNA